MTIKNIPDIDTLGRYLILAYTKDYTGRIDVEAIDGQKWSIYFCGGQLVWCIGGEHWRRRWRRLISKYCRYLQVNEVNLEQQEQGYERLKHWLERGLLRTESAKSLIGDNFAEVLFDILQQENREKLVFKLNPTDKLTVTLPLISLKTALIQSKERWEQWCAQGLSTLSPNLVGYSILPAHHQNLQKQLLKSTDYSYQELVQVLDGQKSLRDIAVLLNKPLIDLSVDLNHHCRDKLALHEIADLPSTEALTHLSPNFNNSVNIRTLAPSLKSDVEPVDKKKLLLDRLKSKVSFKWITLAVILALLPVAGYFVRGSNKSESLTTASQISLPQSQQHRLSQPAKQQDVTLLGDTFSGYSTFRNPNFQKALLAEGIALHYQSQFDQGKRADMLNAGKADLLVTTLDQFLIQQPHGKIVGLIDTTAGADAVVLNNKKYPQLKSLQDLSQMSQQASNTGEKLKIAFAGDTPSEYLALLLSTKFQGLDISNFQVIRVSDAADAWKLMQDGSQGIAVALLWEPFVSQSRKIGYNVTLSSRDVPNSIVDVLVASDRLLQSRPKLVSSVLSAYYHRLDATLTSDSQLQGQIADDGKLSALDAANALSGIKFFTAIEARSWLRLGTLEKTLGYTAGVLTLTGKLNRPLPDFKDLYTPQFIEKSASLTDKTIALVRANDPDMANKLLDKIPKSKQTDSFSLNYPKEIGQLKIGKEIGFLSSSAKITSLGKQELDKLIQDLEQFNSETIAIHILGHTSQVGAANFNRSLSHDRARAVADYLRNPGRLKHEIIVEGKGEDEPLPNMQPNDTRNQRTEIKIERRK